MDRASPQPQSREIVPIKKMNLIVWRLIHIHNYICYWWNLLSSREIGAHAQYICCNNSVKNSQSRTTNSHAKLHIMLMKPTKNPYKTVGTSSSSCGQDLMTKWMIPVYPPPKVCCVGIIISGCMDYTCIVLVFVPYFPFSFCELFVYWSFNFMC